MAPKPKPVVKPSAVIAPYPFNAGWESMWFYDLVMVRTSSIVPPKVEEIQQAVIRYFGVSKVEFFSRRRKADIVRARQIAMYLAKTMTYRSLPEIGRRFGGRDHTTVLHAVRKYEFLAERDPEIRAQIADIRRSVR